MHPVCWLILLGKAERHIQNSGDFVDKVKDLDVPPGQKLIAYKVPALFTSIPLPDATKAVRIKLDEDPKLQDRTPLSRETQRILELLHIQGSAIQTETRSSHGITSVAHNSKPIVDAQPPIPPFSVVHVRSIRSTNTTSMSSLPNSTAWTTTSSSQLSQSRMAHCAP